MPTRLFLLKDSEVIYYQKITLCLSIIVIFFYQLSSYKDVFIHQMYNSQMKAAPPNIYL
jgi:hypothetical protein